MAKLSFGEAEANRIVNAPKYIEEPGVLKPKTAYSSCRVYMELGSDYDLTFTFYDNGTALLLANQRIRGLNWKERYYSPDSLTVTGWHEHIYTDLYDDRKVVAVPSLSRVGYNADAKIIIAFSLKNWNIMVKGHLAGLLSFVTRGR